MHNLGQKKTISRKFSTHHLICRNLQLYVEKKQLNVNPIFNPQHR